LARHDGRYYSPPLRKPVQNLDQNQFPKLTEKEIAANHKQKRKMVKSLSKRNRKEYVYIPSGTFSYKGESISVQAFHMRSEEVTNLEYRTFLFDLLIQGRKNDFLAAAPDQTLWTKALDDSLTNYQNEYFSDSKYNDFPVVNISKKGAEMYCKWITIQINKTRKSAFMNDVRIPELIEWAYAASSLGKQSTYPWEGDQLNTGESFNANFKLDEYDGDLDSIKQITKTSLKGRTSFEYTIGLMIAFGKAFKPTEFGLYNMCGNVAEMVSTKAMPESVQFEQPTENQLVTCGGSWMSDGEDLKIFNESITDDINGHPSIGFRVVITYMGSTK
jgi:formylglycine-generating enzyme required for sulfatase activity